MWSDALTEARINGCFAINLVMACRGGVVSDSARDGCGFDSDSGNGYIKIDLISSV